MQTVWTSHLNDPEEVQRFENTVRSSKPALDRLYEIYSNSDKALDRASMGKKLFEKPNWSLEQAYILGYRACLADNMRIVTLDPKENK